MAKKRQVTLAADTSADLLRLALRLPDGRVLRRSGRSRRQEELLLKFLDSMLSAARLKLSDIGAVAAIRGPGRFTGIRIGLTLASLLSKLSGAKAIGVTMFEALASQLMSGSFWADWLQGHRRGRLAVVVHAFRDEYFAALFVQKGGKPVQDGAPLWLARPKLIEFLEKQGRKSPLLCAGTAERGAELAAALAGAGLEFAPHRESVLDVAELFAIADFRPMGERFIEPLYLKPAKYELL